jgi:ribosomal protein S25
MNKTNWTQNEIYLFWNKVKYPGNDRECWEWTASVDKDGYGYFRIGKTYRAHQLAWEFYNGFRPKGLSVCHKCDNPSCCNPEHLVIATNQENMSDMKNKGRAAKGSKQGKAVFVEQDIIDIINDSFNYKYKSMSEIARKYGTSVTIISHILNGVFWSHITKPLLQILKINNFDLKNCVTRFQNPNKSSRMKI